MNILRKTPLSRRTVIRGGGLTLSLPLLDAMIPRLAHGQAQVDYLFYALGFPAGIKALGDGGYHFTLDRDLARLKRYQNENRVSVFHEVRQGGGGAHNMASILVASPTSEGDSRVVSNESFDVYLSNMLPNARNKKFNPLVLGITDDGSRSPHRNIMSWRGPGSFIRKNNNPANVYSLIMTGPLEVSQRNRILYQLSAKKSALDLAKENIQSFQKSLGAGDRHRVEAYLASIRALEVRISELTSENPRQRIEYQLPNLGAPQSFRGHIDRALAMTELTMIAMATEQTQIASITLNPGQTDGYAYHDGQPGGGDLHHRLDSGSGRSQQAKHHDALAQVFEYALNRARDLGIEDRLALYMASETGRHHVPVDGACVIGGGAWGRALGRELRVEQPAGNNFVYLAQQMGLSLEQFGRSNGRLVF